MADKLSSSLSHLPPGNIYFPASLLVNLYVLDVAPLIAVPLVAVDDVAAEKGIDLYQTPTGWKFFGNLITADRIAICGEESFGAGSLHLQEKDGIWAVLCWLSILSETGKTVEQLAQELWQKHGRIFSLLYDYAGLDKKDASCHSIKTIYGFYAKPIIQLVM